MKYSTGCVYKDIHIYAYICNTTNQKVIYLRKSGRNHRRDQREEKLGELGERTRKLCSYVLTLIKQKMK